MIVRILRKADPPPQEDKYILLTMSSHSQLPASLTMGTAGKEAGGGHADTTHLILAVGHSHRSCNPRCRDDHQGIKLRTNRCARQYCSRFNAAFLRHITPGEK